VKSSREQGKPLSRSGGSVVVETIRWLGEEGEKKGREKKKERKEVCVDLFMASRFAHHPATEL